MINFLPISILAYALNAGSIIIDKILLKSSIPQPVTYAFYISVLGMLAVVFAPFGLILELRPVILGVFSGIVGVLALIAFFYALKLTEASVAGPLVGALNPLFTLILGGLFLQETISQNHLTGFFVLILGALILTFNLWFDKLKSHRKILILILAGFLFAVSYVLLRNTFLQSNFVTGLVTSRMAGGLFVILFLAVPSLRSQIFSKNLKHAHIKQTVTLLFIGQSMGALFGLLVTFAVSLASPALVNSLFGVQYLVILVAALILSKKHPQLLAESLNKGILVQKIVGAGILSLGVYLLSI